MPRRFIVPDAALDGADTEVSGDLFRHMTRVLRMKKGMEVRLADGRGMERTGVITATGLDSLTVTFAGIQPSPPPLPSPSITLYQGLPKGDKLDFIIQKGTELGAAAFVPFSAERSVRKIVPERSGELVRRWQKIATEAARQSEGSAVPEVRLAVDLSTALESTDQPVKILLWEGEETVGLKDFIASAPKPERVAVMIGPEGGLSGAEVGQARACGFVTVSLGRRILRTETAGLAALAILHYCWGDLGDR